MAQLRSPAEYYIKSLLLKKMSLEAIAEDLEDKGLDGIGTKYIEWLQKRQARPPVPFCPDDPYHVPSTKYLLTERLERIVRPDRDMRLANGLLASPRAKEFLEAMILSGAPVAAMVRRLESDFHVAASVAAVQYYQHYYWNIGLLDSTQMRVLLRMRADRGADQYGSGWRDAYYKDPRKMAADLPSSPSMAMLVQARMGFRPGGIDLQRQLEQAREMAVLRILEATQVDGLKDSERAVNYANTARVVTDLLAHVVKPDDSLRKELNAILLRNETKPLPSLRQLAGGRAAPPPRRSDDAE